MKARFLGYGIVAVITAALYAALFATAPAAQNRPANDSSVVKPTPRMADGHPDLSGFYLDRVAGIPNYGSDPVGDAGNLYRQQDGSVLFLYGGAEAQASNGGVFKQNPNQPPYKPEYMAQVKKIADTVYGTITSLDPFLECKPSGVPRVGVSNMHVVANDKFIALMYENSPGPVYRIVYTDGRTHPKDLDTSYMGHSIGHWDGDTLVVDTVGLNDETWYTQTGGVNMYTSIHSDKEHVIEHFTRKGDDLTYEATVEDPVMLTRPWVLNPVHTRIAPADDYIQPQMCNTNDKAHIIAPSATDKFTCGWCQKDPDAVYGAGASKENQENGSKTGAGTRGGGGE